MVGLFCLFKNLVFYDGLQAFDWAPAMELTAGFQRGPAPTPPHFQRLIKVNRLRVELLSNMKHVFTHCLKSI